MQPQVVSREYVKPSALVAHNHPTIHNLSFFDKYHQMRIYMPILFFYPSRGGETGGKDRSSLLKSSLSAALSSYYPLAGRIKDDIIVECNDEGALFLEARMECDLSEILMNPDFEGLALLCPDSLCYKDSSQTGRVAVQVTYFKCGGMSIGVCLCHRVMDMETMSSFMEDWASLARKPDKEIASPKFNIGSLYPPIGILDIKLADLDPVEIKDLVCRRLVFHDSKISDLKQKVGNQVPNPTRVEVVTALVHKSAIHAVARASSSGALKSSVMSPAINMRSHVNPPLSNRNKGNMVGLFPVSTPENTEVELEWLVKEFRKSKFRFSSSCANARTAEEVCSLVLKNTNLNAESELFYSSSWCRFRLFEADFGWGKPLWVGPTPFKVNNFLFLMDTREGDGIEVHICLEDKVMDVFEQDEQLLSFCSINPSIVDSDPLV